MTALLRPDETLTLGVNVIVRPGDPHITPDTVGTAFAAVLNKGRGAGVPHLFVAPQDWVALTGPCLNVRPRDLFPHHSCSECRDGRRIVPLYRRYNTIEDTAIGRVLVGRGIVRQVFQQGDGQFVIVIDCVEVMS